VRSELACGALRNRREILSLPGDLPQTTAAAPDEALQCVEAHRLMGRGLGYVDVHLLATARLAHGRLWTIDKRLAVATEALDVLAPGGHEDS
jgi:hypothetical protein